MRTFPSTLEKTSRGSCRPLPVTPTPTPPSLREGGAATNSQPHLMMLCHLKTVCHHAHMKGPVGPRPGIVGYRFLSDVILQFFNRKYKNDKTNKRKTIKTHHHHQSLTEIQQSKHLTVGSIY